MRCNVEALEVIEHIISVKAPELPKPKEPEVQPTAAKVAPPTAESLPIKGIDHRPLKSFNSLKFLAYLFFGL